MTTNKFNTLSDFSRQTRAALLIIAPLLFLALFVPLPSWAWEGQCVGVNDGDTIKVLKDGQEVKIRLASIDCPERGQPFSQRAKQFTSGLVFRKTVRVEPVTTDRYGRTVAWIYVDGANVNHEIVKAGMGWWYRKYAPDDKILEKLEERAKQDRIGLWADPNPIPPWEWRKEKKRK